jgi:hypothetical protein
MDEKIPLFMHNYATGLKATDRKGPMSISKLMKRNRIDFLGLGWRLGLNMKGNNQKG